MIIQKEVRLHFGLMHPNILKCYGTTHLDEDVIIVLELSSEGSLDEVNLTVLNTYNFKILFFTLASSLLDCFLF